MTDLGSAAFWWRELLLIVEHQNPTESAFRRSQAEHQITGYPEAQRLAILNTLRLMSWQLSGDAKAPRPDPVLLPGQVIEGERRPDAMSMEEMAERLRPYGPQPS